MGIFTRKDKYGNTIVKLGTLILMLVTLIVVLASVVSAIVIVPPGHVGVKVRLGSVSQDELPEGFGWKTPFIEGVTMMSVKTQEYTMSYTKGEGAKHDSDIISALTKEGLSVGLDITILYKLTPSEAAKVYQTIGPKYVSVIVRPPIRTIIREVVAKYEAKQIYSSDRAIISQEIFTELEAVLIQRGIILEQVLLRHVQLPTQLTTAIEAKLTAEQNIEKREFEVEVEKQEAERKRIEAQGIADAQQIIDKTLTKPYLTYLLITHLKDYEGGKIFLPSDLTMDFVYDVNDEGDSR